MDPKKIFSPPPKKIPRFPTNTLPAPSLSWKHPSLLGFSITTKKNRTHPPSGSSVSPPLPEQNKIKNVQNVHQVRVGGVWKRGNVQLWSCWFFSCFVDILVVYWATPPVRLGLSRRNSGRIPERPRKRSQSVSWNSRREYGWGRFFFQKWLRRGPPRAGHGIPSSTGGISDLWVLEPQARHLSFSTPKVTISTLQKHYVQESPRQTKPKKGQFMNFFPGAIWNKSSM